MTDTSSGWVDGAQSRNTVRGRRLLDRLEQRVGRGLGEPVGVLDQHDLPAAQRRRRPAVSTIARISWTAIDSPSGTTMCTSAWVRERTVWQPGQTPQPIPSRSHCSAAAKARAATDRPEPGGPVNSQACVIEPGRGRLAQHDPVRGRGGVPQRLDGPGLADDLVPDGHRTGPGRCPRSGCAGVVGWRHSTGGTSVGPGRSPATPTGGTAAPGGGTGAAVAPGPVRDRRLRQRSGLPAAASAGTGRWAASRARQPLAGRQPDVVATVSGLPPASTTR